MNLSENVIKILLGSISKSTKHHYCSSFNSFINFCEFNSFDPWNCNLSSILEYLVSLFNAGLSYSSINTARSSLSLFLGKIDNFAVGSHPMVVKLLRSMYRMNPPRPRYSTMWKVDDLLNLFMNWPSNNVLELKLLTFKLVGLLALTTGQRAQTLNAISIDNIKFGDPVEIIITQTLKTSRAGFSQPCLVIPVYHNDKMCVVNCLKIYLQRTFVSRKHNNLFLSYVAPYKPVSNQSLSRWLCELLCFAGIDTSYFKGHSFRHASTSKAANSGVPMDIVFRSAGWSERSRMFAKFYNVKTVENSFLSSILSVS